MKKILLILQMFCQNGEREDFESEMQILAEWNWKISGGVKTFQAQSSDVEGLSKLSMKMKMASELHIWMEKSFMHYFPKDSSGQNNKFTFKCCQKVHIKMVYFYLNVYVYFDVVILYSMNVCHKCHKQGIWTFRNVSSSAC